MSKSEKFLSLLLICVLAVLLIGIKVISADVANSYGVAKFHDPTHIPRDGLVERWLLDPGMTGDLLGGLGDFESWTGAEGGCTNCPEGWACDCTSGNIVRENLYVYKGTSSVEVSPVFTYYPNFAYPFTFVANECYQLTFCYKGIEGTEDFYFLATNATLTETYDPTTDTWTAPISGILVNNAGADFWNCDLMYVKTGSATKTPYAVAIMMGSNDGTGVFFDDFEIKKLDSCGVVGERGNTLAVPVTSDPMWGASPELQHKPGSGLATKRGMWLNGTADYLSRADDDTFDPDGSFSLFVAAQFDSVAGNQVIAAKDDGGANRNWLMYNNGGAALFYIWDASGANSNTNLASAFTAGAVSRTVSIYDFVTDGTSDMYTYSNNLSPASQLNADGPVRNLATSLAIGANSAGTTFLAGNLLEFMFYTKALGEIEVNKLINPYFPATRHGDGFWVDTCSQAASHATCTVDRCRDGTPDACQAEGTGVMAAFGQYTELCDDNSFETYTGWEEWADFTHWTESFTDGDGSAYAGAYKPDRKHGEVSARMTLTGTTSSAYLQSACETVGASTAYYFEVAAKKISGTARFVLTLVQYTDAGCSVGAVQSDLYDGDIPEGGWTTIGEIATTLGSTHSIKLRLRSVNSASDILLDAVSIKEATYHTPWVHNPGAGSTTYNARDYRLHNPLSDRSDVLREDMYVSGWCTSFWLYSDWSADGVARTVYYVPGTVGDNNIHRLYRYSNDYIYFEIFDSAAGNLYYAYGPLDSTSWTISDWKYIEMCTNNAGTMKARYYNRNNDTWYAFVGPYGAGTGIQDGQSPTFVIGNVFSNMDFMISDIHIVPYSAVYPMAGFNGGRPPVNGRSY